MDNGDFQAIAQLSVGLNLGFSALFSFFGRSFDGERSSLRHLQDEFQDISQEICRDHSDNDELNNMINVCKRSLIEVNSQIRPSGSPLPRYRTAYAVTAAFASFVSMGLLVVFSVKSGAQVSNCNVLLLICTFLPVLSAIVFPMLEETLLHKRVAKSLTNAYNDLSNLRIKIDSIYMR